tara:strand:+ start:501 stop:701 length:201 start_codon:yes stop_codon:yes gene_type:complete
MDMTQEKMKEWKDENLICIETEVKKYTQLLSDAEWKGRINDISFIQKQLDHFKKLMADGQLYEPKF